MKKPELLASHCSVAKAASVLGDTWTILVIRELFLGSHRFEEIQAQTGASSATVANRLQRIVDHGIAQRVRYSEKPPRSEFRLTRKGAELWPVIVSMMQWGDRWLRGRSRPPLRIVHHVCGHDDGYDLVCRHCGEAPAIAGSAPQIAPILQRERDANRREFDRSIGRK